MEDIIWYVVEGFCSFRFCDTVFFGSFLFQWSRLGNVKMVVLVNGTPEIPWVFFPLPVNCLWTLVWKQYLKERIPRSVILGRGFWICYFPLYSANGYIIGGLDSWDPLMKGIVAWENPKPLVYHYLMHLGSTFALTNASYVSESHWILTLCPPVIHQDENTAQLSPDRTNFKMRGFMQHCQRQAFTISKLGSCFPQTVPVQHE